MDPQTADFVDDDFDDAEDFDDPAYDAAPVGAPHPSVAPKPKGKKAKYADPYADPYADEYADDHAYDGYASGLSGASVSDVSLPQSKLYLRANRLQWLGKTAGQPMRCDVPFSQMSKVELRFAPTVSDLLIVFFFSGLTVMLIELLPAGWLRGGLAILSGLFAAGMLFGVAVTRVLRIHTPERVFDIVLDDDVREAEAFTASLQARLNEHHTGPFR